MKKFYAVLLSDGFVKCASKAEAREVVAEKPGARCIRTASKTGNYYHNRVHVVTF